MENRCADCGKQYELLALSIVLPSIKSETSEVISGLVEVAGPDVLPLFKRDGVAAVMLRRIKSSDEFGWIADPAEGVAVLANDVLLKRGEIERFEKQYGLANTQVAVAYKRPPGPGAPPRYDWDGFYAALARRVHDRGIPASQSELVRDMLEWFSDRSEWSVPDESTIRRRVSIIWRELRR
jgi:hypothetical protein